VIPIALVSDARYEGGAERYLLRLGAGLDRRRWRPVVLLPDRALLDDLAGHLATAGVETVRWRRRRGVLGAFELARAIDRINPRLVHMNMPSPYEMGCGGWARLMARPGRAVVATEHIADIAPSRRRVAQKRLWGGLIDRTITISKAHAGLLASRHGVRGDRIRVVYNGVEDPGTPTLRPPLPFRVVVVGSLEPRKGQVVLLRAAAAAIASGVDMEIVIVGEGPDRELLAQKAKEGVLAGRVRMTGALDSAALEIAAAHVVAVPSLIEGLPFVVAEAMAAGAVPVVSNLPGLDEIVDDSVGRLVPPEDEAAWTGALIELAVDAKTRDRLAAAARARFLERLTRERMIAGTIAVYDETLS